MGAGSVEAIIFKENALTREKAKAKEIWVKEWEARARLKEKGGMVRVRE